VPNRATDEQVVSLLRACRSARDRLIVLLMARGGLRRGEVCGLRRSDVHLLVDSRRLGCDVARAHLHVVRRDNPNGAWAKSRRQRVVPLDFFAVQAFDTYEFERMRVAGTADSDFVFVNLFRGRLGAPMRPDAIGELMAAASRRAGLHVAVRPHQLRHAFGATSPTPGPVSMWSPTCWDTPRSTPRRFTCTRTRLGCGQPSTRYPALANRPG
jgi:integrase/recombinase XerD